MLILKHLPVLFIFSYHERRFRKQYYSHGFEVLKSRSSNLEKRSQFHIFPFEDNLPENKVSLSVSQHMNILFYFMNLTINDVSRMIVNTILFLNRI